MSSRWSDYTSALVDKGVVSRCSIYSHRGRLWAASGPDLVLDKQQFDAMMQGFQVGTGTHDTNHKSKNWGKSVCLRFHLQLQFSPVIDWTPNTLTPRLPELQLLRLTNDFSSAGWATTMQMTISMTMITQSSQTGFVNTKGHRKAYKKDSKKNKNGFCLLLSSEYKLSRKLFDVQ